jgi:DMSO/TMAO reductase YedYZ molybdopterin-dependent catalytic subunit
MPPDPHRPPPGSHRIVRTTVPPNEELDFARLEGLITPLHEFYVRSHGELPALAGEWRLEVGGLVEAPRTFTLEELARLPQVARIATLECAGNRRTFQRPVPGGVAWEDGAISTALWTGVLLDEVLARVAPLPGAQHVVLGGADECRPEDAPAERFERSVPLPRASQAGALLAFGMNGVPLPPLHGRPIRAIVPGHYAMDSVKWLARLTLSPAPSPGYYQARDYRLYDAEHPEGEEMPPVRVCAAIARPRAGAALARGAHRIEGAAWTGTGHVAGVEVSTDAGRTWQAARLDPAALPGVWRLWSLPWDAPPGKHVLLARARDTAGHVQPMARAPNLKGYANNAVYGVPVTVA